MHRRKILMACSNYWNSPIQVGDQNLAREFVQHGWEVAYISTPISPLHLLKGITPDFRERFNNYRSGGIREMDNHLWSYVPGAFVVPHDMPLLRSAWIYNRWQNFTFPNLIEKVIANSFSEIDVLYFREPKQAFWLKSLKHKISIYRIADHDAGFSTYNREVQRLEHSLAKNVDLVLYTANHLKTYVEKMQPKKMLYLPNGVNFSHFERGSRELPPEYSNIKKPIAVYVGSMDEWFDFDLVNAAVARLPYVSFVLIGPEAIVRRRLLPRENLYILGRRSYKDIPMYLHNADVGIIPFNVKKYPNLVHSINPIKLYEYMACGLPVISVEWEELMKLHSPAILIQTAEEFIKNIDSCTSQLHDKEVYTRYAKNQDWDQRFEVLEDSLNTLLKELR